MMVLAQHGQPFLHPVNSSAPRSGQKIPEEWLSSLVPPHELPWFVIAAKKQKSWYFFALSVSTNAGALDCYNH